MSKWMILLALLAPVLAGAEPAWRWRDADGVVHYSDRPVPGAEEVDLPTSQRRTAAATAGTSRAPAAAATPAEPTAQAYTRFDIVSPTPQQTLWNIGATLDVQVALAPALFPGHRLDVLVDGARQRAPSQGTTVTLTDVFRGVHTVQAVIVDMSDTVVLRSAPVEFMVQQTSLLNPNNPNTPVNRARNNPANRPGNN